MAPLQDTKKKRKQQQQDNDDGKQKKNRKKQKKEKEVEEKVVVRTEETKKKKKNRRKEKAKEVGNDGREDGAAGGGSGKKGGNVTDPRFASVHSDPRFQRVPKHQSKVPIDSRFTRMFSDKRFASFSAPVDKRGKPRKGKPENPLLHYYIHQKESSEEEEGEGNGLRLDESEPSTSDEEDLSESASDSSTASSTEEEDDDQCSVNSDVAHYLMANHEDTPQTEQATHRLAAVNMDWDHIKSVDLYVVMNSCLPKDGHISSVAVYPSEFGLKCMEIEATKGPSSLIRGEKEKNDDNDDEDDGDDEIENEKLRSYELNKLRYYFTVIDCDSSTTADHLYKTLDGTELLKTSNVLDLRFIPDSMKFSHPARDITTEAPTSYKEPDFHTQALQHSNVKLSWEEEEPERKKILRRKFNADQLDELEFQDFLASDEDYSGDDEIGELPDGQDHGFNKGDKYLALLQSGDGSDAEDGDDQDMEITFNTGLEEIAKRVREKKENKSESVWEAYLRKRKEKKKSRKKNNKYSSEDDESDSDYPEAPEDPDQPDDFFLEEPSEIDVKGSKKGHKDSKSKSKKGHKGNGQSQDLHKEQEASQAELELLCANSSRAESPPREESKRPGKVKGKKGKKLPAEDKLPKEDYRDDPRFSALFNSHLYALDPTDPQFKRSATYARQVLQRQKHGATSGERKLTAQAQLPPDDPSPEEIGDKLSSKREKHELMSLVRSVQRKTSALQKERK